DILCYRMEGQYYARMHNPVSRKKFWKHKSFEGSRRSCLRLGRGSKLASQVYRTLQGKKRVYALFCTLKSEAIALLKVGRDEQEVLERLREMVGFGRAVEKRGSCLAGKRRERLRTARPVRRVALLKGLFCVNLNHEDRKSAKGHKGVNSG
ncbi:MAG: hypothetical protein JWP27_11, partial [Flaviaesturariibacter sp.]|nr:hypothetical protein [Flaviaesturariibacter sp.]